MRDFWRTATQSRSLSFLQAAEDTVRSFSATGRALFAFFAGLLILSTAGLVYQVNARLLVPVPASGGTLTEGVIGAPRFINPVLAISDADRDLTALVYSGLLKATPSGDYVPDLAESYTVSEDGRTYTFKIRPDAQFHDGEPVTADDVIFTIEKTQDAFLKSPLQANWNGVTVTKVDDKTVQFSLKQAYAPFVENLTLGILPKHLWQDISDDEFPFSDLNTSPVGSGPFRISGITRSSGGVPASYTLKAFGSYALGRPYLNAITFRFYQNEDDLVNALRTGDVEAANGLSPASLTELPSAKIDTSSLNRVFGVFFNQNQSAVLRDHDVRAALDAAVDRQALVKQVLGGYGTPLHGPVPPGLFPEPPAAPAATTTDPALLARNALIKAGWTPGPDGVLQKTTGKGKSAKTVTLEFTLATGNVPELREAAQVIQDDWQRMGAKVDVQVYNQGDLSQNVIRPRKYDALLFGEVIGRELDLFAFWSSSQRVDPGLNIAMYANSTADKILESLRATESDSERQKLYAQFEDQLAKDVPAVFLYAPDFVYTVPKDLQGVDLGFIETPSDRFLSVAQWHRETDYVWPFFAAK